MKEFPGVRAVDGISFSVAGGEVFGFLGPNGAGKTTTLNMITGLSMPDDGRARVDGYDILDNHVQAKRRLGVVSQHVNVDHDLSARGNLLVHGLLFNMSWGRLGERADDMLDFMGLGEDADRMVREFSGGMKRQLQIARSLMHRPGILMLDEPTLGLDAHARRDIWAAVRKINALGATVFLTTHYIEEAENLCGQVAIIDKGKLIALDEPDELIGEVGTHAVDILDEGKLRTEVFSSREEAVRFVARRDGELRIREASLEDYFLRETGRRIEK